MFSAYALTLSTSSRVKMNISFWPTFGCLAIGVSRRSPLESHGGQQSHQVHVAASLRDEPDPHNGLENLRLMFDSKFDWLSKWICFGVTLNEYIDKYAYLMMLHICDHENKNQSIFLMHSPRHTCLCYLWEEKFTLTEYFSPSAMLDLYLWTTEWMVY